VKWPGATDKSSSNQDIDYVLFSFLFKTNWKCMLAKIPMEAGDACEWFLLRAYDNFGLQYVGSSPEAKLPKELDGNISG
jgi:hypothetical protein